MSFVIKALIPEMKSGVAPSVPAPAVALAQTAPSRPAPAPVLATTSSLESVETPEKIIRNVATTLKSKQGVTMQVKNSADKIQTELLSSKNKTAIIPAIKILLDGARTNKDFQKALDMPTSGEKPADGTIGRDTINILLEKA